MGVKKLYFFCYRHVGEASGNSGRDSLLPDPEEAQASFSLHCTHCSQSHQEGGFGGREGQEVPAFQQTQVHLRGRGTSGCGHSSMGQEDFQGSRHRSLLANWLVHGFGTICCKTMFDLAILRTIEMVKMMATRDIQFREFNNQFQFNADFCKYV